MIPDRIVLIHLTVKPRGGDGSAIVSDPAALVRQLLKLIETVRVQSITPPSQIVAQKIICNSFAVLMEASVRDNGFWRILKELAELDRFVILLLLDESRQPVRKGIAENIAIICGTPKSLKRPSKIGTQDTNEPPCSENPVVVDILATIWDAFVKTFPRTPDYAEHSQELFEVALSIFRSVADKSPRDLVYGDYLRDWSGIMLSHRTEEVCSDLAGSIFFVLTVITVCWARACRLLSPGLLPSPQAVSGLSGCY